MIGYRGFLLLLPALAWLASSAMADDRSSAPAQRTPDSSFELLRTDFDAPAGGRILSDPNVKPARYVAEHPNPNEPLGFEGARFMPGTAVDPALNSGVLVDEPIEEYFDETDPDAPAPTVSSGEWLRNGCWYAEQSVVYMIRNVNVKNEITLATDLSSSVLPQDFAHLDIAPEMGYQPGLRSTVGRYLGRDPLNRDHALEFTFLGLTHWQDAASLTARFPGSIVSNLDPTRGQAGLPAFNASNFQAYAATSSFNSYELNYRINRRLPRDQMVYSRDSNWVRRANRSPLPSIFAGLRVVSIAETLKYTAESATANGLYDIATHNNLVGPQIGADWYVEHYEWRLGGRIKAGSLVNWSNQSTRVRILDAAGTHGRTQSRRVRRPAQSGFRRRDQFHRGLSVHAEFRLPQQLRSDVGNEPGPGAEPDHVFAQHAAPDFVAALAFLSGLYDRPGIYPIDELKDEGGRMKDEKNPSERTNLVLGNQVLTHPLSFRLHPSAAAVPALTDRRVAPLWACLP